MSLTRTGIILILAIVVVACEQEPLSPAEADARIAAINEQHVFADMHAHPSRFHRADVATILPEELALYRDSYVDLVVANISSDMAYTGGYVNPDGTEVERGQHKPEPGETLSLSMDRLNRLLETANQGYAVLATTPEDLLASRRSGDVTIMPALEGADALEGDIDNLREMHRMGLKLLQLIHFRNNELGHMQTWPYSPGGLTEFGREVVEESNRLGIIIDMAHANHETMMDILDLSDHPVIFSHGGVRAYTDHDRAVTDEEIEAIADGGGIVGIWPHGRHVETVEIMVDYIEHVIDVAGIDHVGIGSDLRGVSRYSVGFDDDAKFTAIAAELINRGYSDDDVGKVMGGNFFRVWQEVSD